MSDNDQVLEAIKGALAQEPKYYVIKAGAHWSSPAKKQILAIPGALSPTLSADVVFECAKSTAAPKS